MINKIIWIIPTKSILMKDSIFVKRKKCSLVANMIAQETDWIANKHFLYSVKYNLKYDI